MVLKIVPTLLSNSLQYNHCYESEIHSLDCLPHIYKCYLDLHIFFFLGALLSRSVVSNSLQPHGLYAAHQAPQSMGILQA